jgi:hypothetical protein
MVRRWRLIGHFPILYNPSSSHYGSISPGVGAKLTAPFLLGGRLQDIACGGWHTAAITTDGDTFVWGRGEHGRLGLGDERGASKLIPTQLDLPNGERVLQVSFVGDAYISLGDAESSLGDAESSLGGDAESSLGDAESSLGDAESSLGDAESSLGDAKSSLGDAESSLGDAKSPSPRRPQCTECSAHAPAPRW